jgi:ppGpp synthetase/RelA/SpoT-type nucleotidyltranferase
MNDITLSQDEEHLVERLVAHYAANDGLIERLLLSLDIHITEAESLAPLIHSVKKRMKSPSHLKDKLTRKIRDAHQNTEPFNITEENLFTEITDLGGYRILHLHTRQMADIHRELMHVIEEAQFTLAEAPKANVWDKESETYFASIGIQTEYNPRMYSSVHYVVGPNNKAKVRIEIQVRTLSEEIWGEVDHKFNYPHPLPSVACGEQIKVLARVASSCTRLVDSIFSSYHDWKSRQGQANASDQASSATVNSINPAATADVPNAGESD